MRKGVVITKTDGSEHRLEVHGDVEAAIDARITAELAQFPDRLASRVLVPTDPAWQTVWPDAPAPPPAEKTDEARQALSSIFAGTPLQKRQRWMDVREKYGPVGDVLILLRGTLTPDAREHLTELFTRIKAKIGTASEVLTVAEYQALKAFADGKGLGALVPPI